MIDEWRPKETFEMIPYVREKYWWWLRNKFWGCENSRFLFVLMEEGNRVEWKYEMRDSWVIFSKKNISVIIIFFLLIRDLLLFGLINWFRNCWNCLRVNFGSLLWVAIENFCFLMWGKTAKRADFIAFHPLCLYPQFNRTVLGDFCWKL